MPKSYDQNAIQKLLKLDATATHQTADAEGLYNELRALSGLDQNYRDRRYEVWEYHGPISIKVLQEAGVELDKDDESMPEVDGIVIFSGDIVLKVMLNPYDTEEWPYSVFVCEPDEACLFGYGIPHLCANPPRHSEHRMAPDAGQRRDGRRRAGSGEQKGCRPADGTWTLKPKKVWLAHGVCRVATMDVQKAFSSFSINSHQQEYHCQADLLPGVTWAPVSLAAQESKTAFSASQRIVSRAIACAFACGSLMKSPASELGTHLLNVAAETGGAIEMINVPNRTATMLAQSRSRYQ